MKKLKLIVGIILILIAFAAPTVIGAPGGNWYTLYYGEHGLDCGGAAGGCFVPPPN